MTEAAALQVRRVAPQVLLALEIWGDAAAVALRLGMALPAPCRAVEAVEGRWIWWEPDTWLLKAPVPGRDERLARLTAALGDDGAVTDLSGGFAVVQVNGALWRDLLMIGGVFDAHAPEFAPGAVAGTVIHHLPVRLDVISDDLLEVYVPPSYASDLLQHWVAAARRLRAA